MKITDNKKYINEICEFNKINKEQLEFLRNSSLMISGATGLIGSYMIDFIMYKNLNENFNCKIYALGRNYEKGKKRFEKYITNENFMFIECNINEKIDFEIMKCDYILHLASNTHPVAYATDPIGTIETNIIGTKNLLDYACQTDCKRFVFASSCEIYGENINDIEKYKENDLGYINSNTLRAGYPESKRCGEALCQAYIKQKSLDIVIPRLPRCYGPTLLKNDTKALSQFINKGINNDNIVLKSDGTQFYSYCYVADAVMAIFNIMIKGTIGQCYNISDEGSNVKLKDLAKIVAKYCKTNVVFELPDQREKEGYSTVTKSILDNKKIQELGWKAQYNIENGIKSTIDILMEVNEEKI